MKYKLLALAALSALLFAPSAAAEGDEEEQDDCMLFEAWVYQPGGETLFEAWVYPAWIEQDCAGLRELAPEPVAGLLP